MWEDKLDEGELDELVAPFVDVECVFQGGPLDGQTKTFKQSRPSIEDLDQFLQVAHPTQRHMETYKIVGASPRPARLRLEYTSPPTHSGGQVVEEAGM